jgi:hypothetical protein
MLALSAAGRALSGNMMSLMATMPTSLRRSTSTIAFANAVCGRKPAATKAASDEKIALIGTPREEQQTGVTASSMMQLCMFDGNGRGLTCRLATLVARAEFELIQVKNPNKP